MGNPADTQFDFDSISLGLEMSLLTASMQDKALAERASASAKKIAEVVDNYLQREKAIDAMYLPAVKPQQLATVRQEEIERIKDATDSLLGDLAEQEQSFRQRLVPPPPQGSAEAIALQIERRNILRGMDNLQRRAVLYEAIELGDTITVDAFRASAFFDKLIDAATLQTALDAFARAKSPDITKRLAEVVKIRTALQSAKESALRKIGVRPDENIEFIS